MYQGNAGGIANAVDAAACAPAADTQVQVAGPWIDGCGRRSETILAGRLQKHFFCCSVRRARLLQLDKPDPAKGPVEQEEAAAIARGKLRVPITDDPGR